MKKILSSWTGYTKVYPNYFEVKSLSELKRVVTTQKKILIVGNCRSYGDVCLNKVSMVSMKNFNKIIFFDNKKGIIEVESGALLKDLLPKILLHKWFPAVTPGTKYVTVGGMVSNNIHGKNIRNNFFSDYILSITLMNSDGNILICNKKKNKELFQATVGGLGLTGVIISVIFKLKKIKNTNLERKNIYFQTLDNINNIKYINKDYDYNITWINSFSTKYKISGIHFFAKHTNLPNKSAIIYKLKERKINFIHRIVFKILDNYLLYRFVNILFIFYHKFVLGKVVNLDKFFYPQDKYLNWNLLYSKKNFLEFHLFIEKEYLLNFLNDFFDFCKQNSFYSTLIVLKKFNLKDHINDYLCNFDGYSLSFDFNNSNVSKLKNFFLIKSYKYKYFFYFAKDLFGTKKSFFNKEKFNKFRIRINKFNKYKKFSSILSDRYQIT